MGFKNKPLITVRLWKIARINGALFIWSFLSCWSECPGKDKPTNNQWNQLTRTPGLNWYPLVPKDFIEVKSRLMPSVDKCRKLIDKKK